ELNDAQAVERCGKIRNRNINRFDGKIEPLVRVAVDCCGKWDSSQYGSGLSQHLTSRGITCSVLSRPCSSFAQPCPAPSQCMQCFCQEERQRRREDPELHDWCDQMADGGRQELD